MKIRLDSLGCRLNIGESESLARQFAVRGHRIVGPAADADICVLNTCTVTAVASKKSRHMIRAMRRRLPDATIVVTGCHSELQPDEVRALGVDLIIGNTDKDDIPAELERRGLLRDGEHDGGLDLTDLPGGRTRAFLKVQDGCDQRCSYCVVTLARGPGRSIAAEKLIPEVRGLEEAGYQEIVVTGVHLGSYGKDLGNGQALPELLRQVLAETSIPRIRLSSLEPWDLDDGFFEVFENHRVLPHLHLPLQSGCDATLRRMDRRTSRREFEQLVLAARKRVPDVSVTTDIIVGFPGETEDEFRQSHEFVEQMAFSGLHVFRYSRRPGTKAARMPGQVSGDASQWRSQRMRELGARLEHDFQQRFEGSRAKVLWESREGRGPLSLWSGLTTNYIRVAAEYPSAIDLTNRITGVELLEARPGAMWACIDQDHRMVMQALS